jgi:predicted DNA-binding protein
MATLTLRINPELHKRLEECARRTHIKKYTLAILAIEAAVEAIEKNGYRLVVPIEFEVSRVPTEKSKPTESSNSTSVSHPTRLAGATEGRPNPKKKTGT